MLDQVIHVFFGSQFNDKPCSISVFQLTECCVNVLVTVFKETILQECAQMIRNNETESEYTSDENNLYTHETEFYTVHCGHLGQVAFLSGYTYSLAHFMSKQ